MAGLDPALITYFQRFVKKCSILDVAGFLDSTLVFASCKRWLFCFVHAMAVVNIFMETSLWMNWRFGKDCWFRVSKSEYHVLNYFQMTYLFSFFPVIKMYSQLLLPRKNLVYLKYRSNCKKMLKVIVFIKLVKICWNETQWSRSN